jgi:hypothetical protein
MATEFEIVDVWSCRFADRAAFEEYVRELVQEDEDEPLSEFISDQGEPWYDHDFLATRFQDEPSADIEAMLRDGHPRAEIYAPAAALAHRTRGLGPANGTITLGGATLPKPRSVQRKAYRVDYLGRFPCRRDPVA